MVTQGGTETHERKKKLANVSACVHTGCMHTVQGHTNHSPIHRFRMNGKLKQDAEKAARKTVGGLSGLIREGLALRLYGQRNPRRAALLASSRAVRA